MSHSPGHASHPHRRAAPQRVPCWVITASDTRDAQSDTGGALLASLLEAGGHVVVGREIAREDPESLGAALDGALVRSDVRAVLVTGGTGIAPRDITPEVVRARLEREIPGFGELFRQLSYAEIGSAALLSRALGGLARGRLVLALPGSRGAIRLALEKLVLPELGHLAAEAAKESGDPAAEAARESGAPAAEAAKGSGAPGAEAAKEPAPLSEAVKGAPGSSEA